MKYSKRYIVFGVLVAAMLIFKLEPGTSGSGTVENFRGANLQAATWNPLIASSVNDNLLSLVIDNKELHHPKKYGFIVTNPPYGERLEDKSDLPKLYGEIGDAFRGLDSWSMYLITSYDEAERYIGRKADKNRKIYNGMLRTYFYQFMGPKPPRRSVRDTAGGDE